MALSRIVYVDESNCIGCTNCATIARNTFYMNDEHGRARAFRQGADSEEIIDEAVSTCPVDCIWYVSWDDLVILEEERKYLKINNQVRPLLPPSLLVSALPPSSLVHPSPSPLPALSLYAIPALQLPSCSVTPSPLPPSLCTCLCTLTSV
jgi:ferredoxin